MINIHKNLWVIKALHRKVEDSDQVLAYMTHTEYNKVDNTTPLESFSKRMETGKYWAKANSEELTFDNSPIDGFKIVGSVSRWSTSNKLIQVEDPRGFVVEIPTSNLTTLLKHTTVTKGEVLEPCVWGRDGGNHILLPVGSEVYKLATTQTKLNNNKVSFSKLSKGEVVKFSVEDNIKYTYLGRAKITWALKVMKAERFVRSSTWSYRFKVDVDNECLELIREIQDTKLCYLFSYINPYDNTLRYEYKVTGKAIQLDEVIDVSNINICIKTLDGVVSAPDRVIPDNFVRGYSYDVIPVTGTNYGWYNRMDVVSVDIK